MIQVVTFTHGGKPYRVDFSKPQDISVPLVSGPDTVNCFYAPFLEMEPVRAGDFVGSVREGGVVNYYHVKMNPHGNGTHTECVGHLAPEHYSLQDSLRRFHFMAGLHTVYPTRMPDGDRVITLEQLEGLFPDVALEALILRTMPNSDDKCRRHYSGTNPPYLAADAAAWMVERGILHLLIDLPSVDREEDGGMLAAHKAFWQYPEKPRMEATITELIFVNNSLLDGLYLLNLQICSLSLDASPSKPVLFSLI